MHENNYQNEDDYQTSSVFLLQARNSANRSNLIVCHDGNNRHHSSILTPPIAPIAPIPPPLGPAAVNPFQNCDAVKPNQLQNNNQTTVTAKNVTSVLANSGVGNWDSNSFISLKNKINQLISEKDKLSLINHDLNSQLKETKQNLYRAEQLFKSSGNEKPVSTMEQENSPFNSEEKLALDSDTKYIEDNNGQKCIFNYDDVIFLGDLFSENNNELKRDEDYGNMETSTRENENQFHKIFEQIRNASTQETSNKELNPLAKNFWSEFSTIFPTNITPFIENALIGEENDLSSILSKLNIKGSTNVDSTLISNSSLLENRLIKEQERKDTNLQSNDENKTLKLDSQSNITSPPPTRVQSSTAKGSQKNVKSDIKNLVKSSKNIQSPSLCLSKNTQTENLADRSSARPISNEISTDVKGTLETDSRLTTCTTARTCDYIERLPLDECTSTFKDVHAQTSYVDTNVSNRTVSQEKKSTKFCCSIG